MFKLQLFFLFVDVEMIIYDQDSKQQNAQNIDMYIVNGKMIHSCFSHSLLVLIVPENAPVQDPFRTGRRAKDTVALRKSFPDR